jgi:hypothetical protein
VTNPAKKRQTWVAVVIVIAILSSTILIVYEGRTSSPVPTGTTTSVSSASLSQSRATSTASSSSSAGTPAQLGFSLSALSSSYVASSSYLAYTEEFVSPNVKMNYTVKITQIDNNASHVVLSAASSVPGVTAVLTPKEFTFLGNEQVVNLQITVAPTVNSLAVPIEIIGTTPSGVSNSTFTFSLEKGLIVVSPGANGIVKPTTLHVGVGEKIKWLDLIEIDDDGGGYVNIMLADGSAASPTMTMYDLWTYTLDKPGTYTYQVHALSYVSSSMTIVVS